MSRYHELPPWFGQRVTRTRLRLGLSMRQLADRAQLAPSTVMYAENSRDVALSSALAIAQALGLSLDTLTEPPPCEVCDGDPHPGFICGSCGRSGASVRDVDRLAQASPGEGS